MQHGDAPFITIAIRQTVFEYSCYNVYRHDKACGRQFVTLPLYFQKNTYEIYQRPFVCPPGFDRLYHDRHTWTTYRRRCRHSRGRLWQRVRPATGTLIAATPILKSRIGALGKFCDQISAFGQLLRAGALK